ncbi:MAG: hypothetical protein OXK17_00805 [Thaumarchaeota archaeon]|nr:hypothetical protein [Nitrososphaerota archaeon]
MWLLTINYYREFTDFRVQALDDNPFPADVPAADWPEFLRLARAIRDLGLRNFLTKNVRKRGAVSPYGAKLGEFNVTLTDRDPPGRVRLRHSLSGFKSPECNGLRGSRLYPALNYYIARVVRPGPGTIFG